MNETIFWALAKQWGPQAVLSLIVYLFLSLKISGIQDTLSEIKVALKADCEEHQTLHDRATKNEAGLAYLKGKLNGQHETK